MTPQERDLIVAVAQRLRGTQLMEKDYEAERLIQSEIGNQPNALYLLTQMVIVQEQGLRHAQEHIQQLEAQLQTTQARPGSFLSGLFGGGSTRSATGSPMPSPAPNAASSAPGGSAAGSFLRSAAGTAAGIIGGQLIYDGLRNMLGGSSHSAGGAFPSGPPVSAPISEPNNPERSSISGGSDWDEDLDATDDSEDDDDSLAGGGDFDTDSEGSGDYDDSDSY
jgi:hypothetical protein